MKNDYIILYKSIGHHFQNKNLIIQALTHRSKRKQHNERLEFLGDSLLGFIIAEALYQKFPDEDEGNLSLLRIYLVCGKTLTGMAKNLNLGSYIILGAGELKTLGHRRSRLLEDAFEALIGAIYLDSDFNKTKSCILSWYQQKLETLKIAEHTKDPKSRLQEYLQNKIHMHPKYNVINIHGEDHNQTFIVEVSLGNLNKTFQAKGKSRKKAEHMAAKVALSELNSGMKI